MHMFSLLSFFLSLWENSNSKSRGRKNYDRRGHQAGEELIAN
jgi:hypothetical protein